MPLFTLGYEGAKIEDFLGVLCAQSVDVIVDVRQLPLSRKPGFSKGSFHKRATAAGLDYIHAPIFGCPKNIREKYKLDSNWNSYTVEFEKYLNDNYEIIVDLAKFVKDTNACLVCFEKDYRNCHRGIIANYVDVLLKSQTIHLVVE